MHQTYSWMGFASSKLDGWWWFSGSLKIIKRRLDPVILSYPAGRMKFSTPTYLVATFLVLHVMMSRSEAAAEASSAPTWTYEGALGFSGKSGSGAKQDGHATLKAVRATAVSRLEAQLLVQTGSADDANGDSRKTSDEWIGKADFTSYFSSQWGWQVKQHLERDRFENIKLRSLSSLGLSFKAVQESDRRLEFAAGFAHRYESYGFDLNRDGMDDRSGSESQPGMNLGLKWYWKFAEWAEWNLSLDYNPVFEDMGDYRLDHQSTLDIPLGYSDAWKLRLLLANQYKSVRPVGQDASDTTYALSLLFKW
jgi:hypothetical protein